MPKFVTVGYGDSEGYERTDPALRDEAHAHDARLREMGATMGIAGKPVQVRNPDAQGTEVVATAYMTSPLPVAGFMVLEAADLDEAIRLVSQSPCAIAHGVVEIWPLQET